MTAGQHNRTSYAHGCRCEQCRAAQATYLKDYRARRRAAGAPLTVARQLTRVVKHDSASPGAPEGAGSVVGAVCAELDGLPGAKARPGLAAAAVAMAAILDNPQAISTQPSACRQLLVALDKLHAAGVSRGRLATVQAMSMRR
jgi:hypothetical protein